MGHGATSSGKYYNGCTTADVNKGCYGKLSSEQIKERVDLHARRKIEGRPTIAEIANHWMENYGIEMSYQSEKQWALTDDNICLIEARKAEIEASGELVKPTLSTQTLLNSLAEAARSTAENCRNLKMRLNSAMNQECTPWDILGMDADKYFSLIGPRRQEADSKAQSIIQGRKDALKLAAEYSRAHINMSKEFRASVKQTYDMAKYLGIIDARTNRKRLNDATQAQIEDVTEKERIRGSELTEAEIEAAREELGYGDN